MAADIKAGAKKEELRGTLPAGTRLRNYELISVLGHGGFGITYYAKDTTLGREVAIKEYLPTSLALREDGTMVVPRSTQLAEDFIWGRERFLEEARILATLDGAPAVVRVHDFLEANGTAYMIMGLARGDTLEKRLKDGGCLDAEATEHMLRRLLDGLEAVHRTGFLHRDVKPANIILDGRNDPTLIDFGASRASMADRTAALTAIFTPRYAAAEQLTSDKQGPWTDIYGVSATLYHAITGKAPPSSLERALNDAYEPLESLEPEGYSLDVLQGIDAGLAVRAKDRPQSIAEWRGILFPGEQPDGDDTVYDRPSKTSQQPRPTSFTGGDSTHGKRSKTTQPRPSVESARPRRTSEPSGSGGAPPEPTGSGFKAVFADKKRVAVAAAIAAVLVLGIGGYLAFGTGSPPPVLTAEEQAAKAQRDAEAKRQAEAAAVQKKAEEDRQKAEAAAAAQKKAEEDRQKAEAAAAAQKKAEEDRQKADAAAAAQRKAAEDLQRAEAAAAALKKVEEDRQKAEAAAAAQKKAEEDRLKAEAAAAQKKAEEDRRKAEAAAAAQRKAEEDRQKADAAAAAQKKAEEDRLKAEAAAAQKKAEEDRRKAEAAAAAQKKAEEDRQKAEEDRQRAEAAAAAQKKAEEDRLKAAEARQKADAEAAALKLAETTEAALKLSPVDRQRVQVALTSLGFDTQGSDGVLGPRSREMILNWQRARKQLPTTGYLTAAQQQALLGEAAPAVAKFDDDQKKAEAAAKARAATNTGPSSTTSSTTSTTPPRTSNSYGISCQDPSGRRIDYPGESSCPFGFRPVR